MLAPILILQHERARPPGYLSDFLAHRGRPTTKILLRSAADLPGTHVLDGIAGVVVLDAALSALDAPPGQDRLVAWLSARREAGVPLLAHGYGAQLVALAAGAGLTRTPGTRGWFAIRGETLAPQDAPAPRVLLWHDTLAGVPAGFEVLCADRRGRPLACSDGGTLLLQFAAHVAPTLYDEWLAAWRGEAATPTAEVQTLAELEHARKRDLPAAQRVARALYEGWLARCDGAER